MGFSINIDTGGTFTDGFFARDEELKAVKVLTTHHDLTVCFMECITTGAREYGLEVEELLRDTEIIRYSTTIGTNAIIQRTGPKLGLLVSAGYEDNLYGGQGDCELEFTRQFVSQDMIRGICGQIGPKGEDLIQPKREAVLKNIQQLIDQGARAIVVSLYRSYLNPIHEQQIKSWVKEEFPRYYLGSPSLFLASEISERPGERLRTNTALINAYIHRTMARYLYKAEEDVRNKYYDRPLLVVHSSGGVARVAKTKALHTYNSGPVAGLTGVNRLRQLYGLRDVISTDMGGTSLDIGVVRNGEFKLDPEPEIAGLKVNQPMLAITALGAGGGSIAWLAGGKVEVGPESAGSMPGPACFGLGGQRPTVTDADLVLGFIDPEYFLGGRIKLNRAQAVESIQKEIAGPLNISVEQAAARIKHKVDSNIVREIEAVLGGTDRRPEAAFAYGGAGPTHCCGYLWGLNIPRIITSPYSPVFSAFGLGSMDVVHKYAYPGEVFLNGETGQPDQGLVTALDKLKGIALRNMRGEGFSSENVEFYLDCLVGSSGADGLAERVVFAGDNLTAQMLRQLTDRFGDPFTISSVVLNAVACIPHHQIPKYNFSGSEPSAARKGVRQVYWPELNSYQATPIYQRELLASGNRMNGPAIIEAADTSCVVPPGLKYTVDEYLNGIIEGVE